VALAGRVVAEAMGIGLLDTRWTADALVAGALDGSTSSTGGGTIFAGLNDDGIVEEACGGNGGDSGCVGSVEEIGVLASATADWRTSPGMSRPPIG